MSGWMPSISRAVSSLLLVALLTTSTAWAQVVSVPGDGNAGMFTTTTIDPTAMDDINDGYIVGWEWRNTSAVPPSVWILTDNTAGAAVWQQTNSVGAAAQSLDALVDNDPRINTATSETGALLLCPNSTVASTLCTRMYHNGNAVQQKDGASSLTYLPTNGHAAWFNDSKELLLSIDEANDAVEFTKQTASRCARFDANKRLVASSGDCVVGNTTVYGFSCSDHVTGTVFLQSDSNHATGTCVTSDSATVETSHVVPYSGVVERIHVKLSAAPSAGATWTFTARLDFGDTTVVCSIIQGAGVGTGEISDTECQTTGGAVAVTAGQYLSVKHVDSTADDGTQGIRVAVGLIN